MVEKIMAIKVYKIHLIFSLLSSNLYAISQIDSTILKPSLISFSVDPAYLAWDWSLYFDFSFEKMINKRITYGLGIEYNHGSSKVIINGHVALSSPYTFLIFKFKPRFYLIRTHGTFYNGLYVGAEIVTFYGNRKKQDYKEYGIGPGVFLGYNLLIKKKIVIGVEIEDYYPKIWEGHLFKSSLESSGHYEKIQTWLKIGLKF